MRGGLGDALDAVLCGAGHNLHMILRKLGHIRARILALLLAIKEESGGAGTLISLWQRSRRIELFRAD